MDKVSGMTSQPSLGEIKLKFQYTEEKIYNLPIYLGLQGCLMEKGISLIKFIYKILKKQDITTMGSSLIKIFDANMDTLRFIQELLEIQFSEDFDASLGDEKTLFRENSLFTKCFDYFMYCSGASYLRVILAPILTEINENNISLEVDPFRISKHDLVQKNMAQIQNLAQSILNRIFDSSSRCPEYLFLFFFYLFLNFCNE